MRQPTGPDDQASSEAQAWHARLRGEPSEDDRREFEIWHADPANRQAYGRIDADWDGRYGLLAQTAAGRSRRGLSGPAPRHRPAGYAVAVASVLMLLVAALLVLRPGTEPTVQAQIFATEVGEIRTIALPDRSELTLDTDSRVAVRFGESVREVELQQGRARFAVRAEPGRPFVVRAEGSEIVARGTSFDVRLGEAGATVLLIDGKAEVHAQTSSATASERRTLRPGERVVITPQGQLQAALPASAAELRWPSGMIEFRNASLADAILEANRYSRTKIEAGDARVGQLRITGTFRAGDTAGLARSLAAAFELSAEKTAAGTIVLRSARLSP